MSERGAVLVEAAFVFPVFILLLFGMIEFGFIFKDSLTLSSMVQAAARTGSEVGNQVAPSADYEILSALEAGDGSLGSTIDYVVIFKADGVDSATPPGGCSGSTPVSVVNECNVYGPSFFQTPLGTTEPPNEFDCNTQAAPAANPADEDEGSLACDDSAWDPAERNVTETGGPDYLGVKIIATHNTITGFWKGVTLSDTTIMRLEPQSFGSP
jgi:hypothetical protein